MAKEPKNRLRDLQSLFKAQPVQRATYEERRRVLYYPDLFKRHYMDVLARYRETLAHRAGKPVGWQTIRDLVMAHEDEKLSKAQGDRWQVDVGTDRPRSTLVTVEDFKGWYDPKKKHLPSDIKFQYIERYVRGLRVTGEIDAIEQELDQLQIDYIRDALHLFYRPVPYAGETELLREINMERIERLVSHACFELKTPLLPLPPGQTGHCLLLLRDYVSHITPVEILMVRQRGEGGPDLVTPVFSGFLLSETVLGVAMTSDDKVSILGSLVLTRQSGATAGDDGVRVLSQGTTVGTLASFGDNALEMSLGGGDESQLLKAVFGVDASAEEAEQVRVEVKRVDPGRYFPDGEIGRFFRYRPWG